MYGVLDSACWNRTGVSAPSISEELNVVLAKHKLVPFMRSSKGRVEGANAFKQRLVGNEMKDGTLKPAIYFFKTCYNCIRTIPTLSHDKHDPEKYNTSGEDHCTDAVVYACLSRPFTPTKIQKKDRWDRWQPKKKGKSVWTY